MLVFGEKNARQQLVNRYLLFLGNLIKWTLKHVFSSHQWNEIRFLGVSDTIFLASTFIEETLPRFGELTGLWSLVYFQFVFFHLIKTIRCNSFQIENANFPSPLKSFNDFKICCFYLSNFCHRKIVIAKDLPSEINTPFFCTLFIRRDRKLKKWKKIGVRICSSKCSFLSLKFGFRLNSSFILFNLAWYFSF